MQVKIRPLPQVLPKLDNISPILQRIYAARGITDLEMLDKRLQSLLPFHSLLGIEKACDRLEKALLNDEKILIIGDFDADGATSSALAVSALRAFGAKDVDYLVPNRFEFGYGLTPAIVDEASKRRPSLIITVDNGITSVEGVARAHALSIDVIVTDHHLPAEVLPDAVAIVNPNQPDCPFESKSIAGVGVIFYVMLALRRHLVDHNWFSLKNIPEPNMAQFLDLVALGTVADVVGLDRNNRILVNQGLSRIRQGYCRPGIHALVEIAGKDLSRLRETDLGFALAPRLNAAGRLDDMSLGIECLLSDSFTVAKHLAEQLDALNIERRRIEQEMKEQALASLERLEHKVEENRLPLGLCLHDESWHQGVIGILAGRLKDRYHRPVIALASVSPYEMKGSARSIAGVNIRDVLAAIDKDHPGLITKFGGHAMAAGLSLVPEHLDAFRKAYVLELSQHIDSTQCAGVIYSDGALSSVELSLETAQLLHQAGPWGQQFPEPLFDNQFEVLDQRLVGQHHLKMTLSHPKGGAVLDAIAFNVDLKLWPNHRARFIHAAYKLDVNFYQGRTRMQLLIEAMQAIESLTL